MNENDLAKEQRAFELLQWNPYSLPAEFNWELAHLGHYSKLQKERSDTALDEADQEHEALHKRHYPSSELDHFHELNRIGVLGQLDLYSPGKAQQHFYSQLYKAHSQLTDDRSKQAELRRAVSTRRAVRRGRRTAAPRPAATAQQ